MKTEQNRIMRTGRIYTIRSFQTDKYYIGSTFQKLSKRMGCHRRRYRKGKTYISSYEIIKYDDHYIELLETLECKTTDELRKREGELQREHKNNIVNISIECRTSKEYYDDNKIMILMKKRKYRKENPEKTKIIGKTHYDKHREKINYKRRNARYICICGINLRKDGKKDHDRSKKHQKYISDNNL